jgi:PAS domain S-box-containing protein
MRRAGKRRFSLNDLKMPNSIVEVKKSIVNNILTCVVVVGGLLVIITFIRDLSVKLPIANSITNLLAVLSLLVILLAGKRIEYNTKTWIVIGLFIFVGVKSILINGIGEAGYNFFLFASIIALLILSPLQSRYVIIGSSVAFAVVTLLFAFHLVEPTILNSTMVNAKVVWLSRIFSYAFLLFIVIGGVGRLQKAFMKSIHDLDETNQKLNQYNEELRNQLEYTKQMEYKVTEKEINFKTLFDESNDGIIVCDADGRIMEANKAIAAMLDYPKSYIIGNPSADFVISDDKRAINQLSIDKIHSAKIRELQLVGKTGNRIPVEVNYSVITFNEEKSILVTVRDIRERKQTEQKVLNAVIQAEENERSRFAKDLHDDLGPILSSIKMYIQSLRNHEDSPDKK